MKRAGGYIVTDLNIYSRRCPNHLIEALEGKVLTCLETRRQGSRWRSYFQLMRERATPEKSIVAMLDVLEQVDGELLQSAGVIEFDIGVEPPSETTANIHSLSNRTLGRIAKLEGSVAFTLYSYQVASLASEQPPSSVRTARE